MKTGNKKNMVVGADGIPFNSACGVLHTIVENGDGSLSVLRDPPVQISKPEFKQAVADKLTLPLRGALTSKENPVIVYITGVEDNSPLRRESPLYEVSLVKLQVPYTYQGHQDSIIWIDTRENAKDFFRFYCDHLLWKFIWNMRNLRSPSNENVWMVEQAYSASSIVGESLQRERVYAAMLACVKRGMGDASKESVEFDMVTEGWKDDAIFQRVHEMSKRIY